MQLRITIPADTDTQPDDPAILAELGGVIARQASAWTEPVYVGDDTSSSGARLLVYLTDAVPRSATTTANVAPVLRPALKVAHRFRTIRKRSTTAAGYGYEHQQERARRLRTTNPHDPCGYCGKPLGDNRRLWALPHNAQRTAYLPGFWHKRCNDLDGAKRGNARQRAKRQPRAQSRTW